MAGAHSTGLDFAERAEQRHNCLDFLRFFFASLVIFSHSFAIFERVNAREPLYRWSRGQITLADVAVEGFFILSGFLVLQSWQRSRGAMDYFKKRALRIYPAYICASLICALFFGPLGTPNIRDYINAFDPYRFLGRMILLQETQVPLVFPNNPLWGVVNSATWTIRFEGGCYLLVALLGWLAFYRRRFAATLLLLACSAAYAGLQYGHYFSWDRAVELFGGPNFGWLRLGAFFLAGMNFYLWRDRIPYRWWIFLLLAAITILARRRVNTALLLFGPYLLFYVGYARSRWLRDFARHGDYSYGLYLYAWPIQQCYVQFLRPHLTPYTLFLCAFLTTSVAAFASWHLIEKRFLRLKRQVTTSTRVVEEPEFRRAAGTLAG